MTILNIYIFNSEGKCLLYNEYFRKKRSDLSEIEENKLMFGMIASMKAFANRLSPDETNQTINYFKTSKYKMTFLESATGIKIILNTDPKATGVRSLIQTIYKTWVETVNSGATLFNKENFEQDFLKTKITEVVQNHPCYV